MGEFIGPQRRASHRVPTGHGGDYGTGWQEWQKILNAPDPADVFHAVEQPPDRHIRVIARIDWAADGVEWLTGTATRWTREHVYVVLDRENGRSDVRITYSLDGVWVSASDVQRR